MTKPSAVDGIEGYGLRTEPPTAQTQPSASTTEAPKRMKKAGGANRRAPKPKAVDTSKGPEQSEQSEAPQPKPARETAAPVVPTKAAPRRIRARSVVANSGAKTLASEMVAAAAAADVEAAAGVEGADDPPDFEVTFTVAGLLGITWSSMLDGEELGFAFIKTLKPGGQASKVRGWKLILSPSHVTAGHRC